MKREQKSHGEQEQNGKVLSDKGSVKAGFKTRLTELRNKYYKSALEITESAKDADGPMQSQHDTRGKEQSWLANAFGNRMEKIDQILKEWDKLFPNTQSSEVSIGSVVLVQDDEYDRKDWFFLVPFDAGGLKIEIGEATIQALNASSPLGKSIAGKSKSEVVTYNLQEGRPKNSQTFMILEIL